jgi:branched-chain amino acid transport system permease protein
VIGLYQTELLIYGLTFAIAALGFNLLLGYTGLLSFGHSAYFGMGAYTVAFIVRDLHVQSMELCILGGLLSTLLISALFGYVCVRHTRIFFGILTLAPVAGAVEPGLQVLLGDGRHRRHPRAARQDPRCWRG